jgi:hypothetical protein
MLIMSTLTLSLILRSFLCTLLGFPFCMISAKCTYIGFIVERLNGQGAEGASLIILEDCSRVDADDTFDGLYELNQIRGSDH